MAVRLSPGRRNGCEMSRNESLQRSEEMGRGEERAWASRRALSPGGGGTVQGLWKGFLKRNSIGASERPLAACRGFVVGGSGGQGRSWPKEVWADLEVA